MGKKDKDKKGKKKKEKSKPMTGGDKAVCALEAVAALMWIPTLFPFASWRAAEANQWVGARFPSNRKMWLLGTYDNLKQRVSWSTLKRETCKKNQEFMSGSMSNIGASVMSDAVGATGSMLGCGQWPNCKKHVTARCNSYYMVWVYSMVTLAFIFISMVMGFVFIGTLGYEYSLKKKKDIDTAKQTTMGVAIGAFFTAAIAMLTYVVGTMMEFDNLQKTAYYPYPGVSWAAYIGYTVLTVYGIVMLYCIYRKCKADPEEEEEEAKEGNEEPAEAAPPPPGGDMYGAPGMYPGY